MSFANYGPTFRTQTVANLLVGNIEIAPVLAGDPQSVANLIQTAAGAEIPLVLGEGTWAVSARAYQNVNNGAETYQYIQCLLEDLATVPPPPYPPAVPVPPIAACPAISGSDILNGDNQFVWHQCSGFVTIAPGATRSLVFRCYATGNTAIVLFTPGYAQITATKISA
jgi:hypothetical protein